MQKMPVIISKLKILIHFLFLIILISISITSSVIPTGDSLTNIRKYTNEIEYDYISWVVNAFGSKLLKASFPDQKLMTSGNATDVVRSYLELINEKMQLNAQLEIIYTDPAIKNPLLESQIILQKLDQTQKQIEEKAPIAESILQDQLKSVLVDLGFGIGGQIIPSPLFRMTELPLSLVISPRERISRLRDFSIESGLTVDQRELIENRIQDEFNYSALIVPVGGIGAYPTMIMQTQNLVWLTEVISHEWTHNYLTLRPLGINYNTSEELRTINETTASLVGKELGEAMLVKFYQDLLPQPNTSQMTEPISKTVTENIEVFDFRAEMKITRDTVDSLLLEGKIQQAEEYMEQRRLFFWDNGYFIRKINQAYFAFYGAYNDEPGGGPSGSDPVGPAVTALRENSQSLKQFLQLISQITSYDELINLVN